MRMLIDDDEDLWKEVEHDSFNCVTQGGMNGYTLEEVKGYGPLRYFIEENQNV
jgi:hypothetical protein